MYVFMAVVDCSLIASKAPHVPWIRGPRIMRLFKLVKQIRTDTDRKSPWRVNRTTKAAPGVYRRDTYLFGKVNITSGTRFV